MKFKLRAKVDGDLFLGQPNAKILAQRDDLVFELESDNSRRVIAISVTGDVPADRVAAQHATITHTPGAATDSRVDFHADKDLHHRLLGELQAMESILAFNWRGHPLRRILWNEAEMTLVPENAEEEARIHLWSLSVGRKRHPQPTLVKESSFKTLVEHAPRFESLKVSTGFWREAGNQMDAGNYAQAFYGYFFVIEDLYADGKTSEKQVLKAFADSVEFCEICASTLPRFFGKGDKHEENLRKFFDAEGCATDAPGLQRFLFRMRGNLHHYFGKSPRPHPTPFNQDQFHVVALVALFISSLALSRRVLDLNRQHGTIDKNTDSNDRGNRNP
jgi:hypothetical protein